jgi:4-hydroxy-tetrahydrodipicolinate synthase
MKNPIFTGCGVAIVTPMLPDGKVNFAKLDELIDFQIQSGIDSIVICGTTGESSTLTAEEHIGTITHTIDYVGGRCKVIAGTGSNNTAHALEVSKAAADAGADALLLVTPYYNKTTQKGLVEHYTYIADRVSAPLIVYNVPSRTGVGMTVETYQQLSKHPNINGVKEASGNIALAARTIAACGDEFNVWSGNDDQIAPLMSIGAKGVISVLANLCPAETVQMSHLCLEGNYAEAGKMQVEYMELIDALFCEVNPIPIKTALNLLGQEVGPLRLPLCEMEEKNLEKLKAVLNKYGYVV